MSSYWFIYDSSRSYDKEKKSINPFFVPSWKY